MFACEAGHLDTGPLSLLFPQYPKPPCCFKVPYVIVTCPAKLLITAAPDMVNQRSKVNVASPLPLM